MAREKTSAHRRGMRTVADLVAAMLVGEEDDEPALEALSALCALGTREVFDAACALLDSPVPKARMRGAQVLGGLGASGASLRPQGFIEESRDKLIASVRLEEDADAQISQCIALGKLGGEQVVAVMVALADHPYADTRYGAVRGLQLCSDEGRPALVAALCRLSADSDAEIRDFATFALADLEEDSPALRATLRARLTDEDGCVRGEALRGLAQRSEASILGQLRAEISLLEREREGIVMLEAAQALGDRSLLPDLIALRDRDRACDEHFRIVLDRVIAALGE